MNPLEERLSEALRSELADSPVDASGLVEGTHRQVRRVRQRRAGGLAAVVALVLAVPVGYEVAHPESTSESTPAALLPGQSPSPVATLPRSLAFSASELPRGLSLDLSLVSDRLPVVSGQQCGAGAGTRPRTGRQWSWSHGSANVTAGSVDLVVPRGKDSAAAFAQMVSDTGVCRWTAAPAQREFTAPGADTSWAATTEFSTLHYGRAVVRVGNLIAGVEVQSPAGTTQALTTAENLASSLTPRLRKAA